MAENKHDGVFTGETRTITTPDPTGIPPNNPRPEMTAPVANVGSHSLGPGWSGTPKVPTAQPLASLVADQNTPNEPPDDVAITPVTNPSWRDAGRDAPQ